MNFQPLKYIYQASELAEAYTLLLLHGTGGNEKDLLGISKEFGSDFNVLSLRGNVSENGMPRFFKRLGMGIFDEQDLTFRTHEIVDFITKLAEQEGFNPRKVIALGYSNGANIAAGILSLYPDFLAGAILFRPMQPFRQLDPAWKNTTLTPVFTSNGLADPTIDPSDTLRFTEALTNAGFEVSSHSLPTGHGLTREDLQLAINWYQSHFKA